MSWTVAFKRYALLFCADLLPKVTLAPGAFLNDMFLIKNLCPEVKRTSAPRFNFTSWSNALHQASPCPSMTEVALSSPSMTMSVEFFFSWMKFDLLLGYVPYGKSLSVQFLARCKMVLLFICIGPQSHVPAGITTCHLPQVHCLRRPEWLLCCQQ